MTRPLKKLQQMIGHLVTIILVEIYLYEGDANVVVNDIQLIFDNGFSLVIGCSGDGSVFVRKGEIRLNQNLVGVRKAELKELEEAHGLRLEKIDATDNSITLGMFGKQITFENDDDELVIYINEEEKRFLS